MEHYDIKREDFINNFRWNNFWRYLHSLNWADKRFNLTQRDLKMNHPTILEDMLIEMSNDVLQWIFKHETLRPKKEMFLGERGVDSLNKIHYHKASLALRIYKEYKLKKKEFIERFYS